MAAMVHAREQVKVDPGGLLLEVCCGDLDSARAALRGGCGRIELCAALSEGGVTPSLGLIEAVVREAATFRAGGARVEVFVLVRPRSGDFCYSAAELDVIHRDIIAVENAGADGIVETVKQALIWLPGSSTISKRSSLF